MRRPFRSRTIRGRIVALTLIPVLALIGLWTSAMLAVTGDLRALIRLQSVYETFGIPVDTVVGEIQTERRLAAGRLGADRDPAARAALAAQQRSTDRAVRAMRATMDGPAWREDLTDGQRAALADMAVAAARLKTVREQVAEERLSWNGAVDAYTRMVQPAFRVQSALTALQSGPLAREMQVVIELVRVREFVSREDALVTGARAAGTLTDRQYHALTAAIEDRRVFHRTYVPDLPADSRALFEEFARSEEYRALRAGEDALLRADPSDAGRAIAAGSWRTTTDRAADRYVRLCSRAATNASDRARTYAYRELAWSIGVGLLGLAAVGLSIRYSVRSGRRISRRLETLRDAADLLTDRQLPELMERLSAGETVDAATVAPPLSSDDGDGAAPDEIGQLGRAMNTARRAVVAAAVRQARARRGVFAVLLNIARRHQALVYRQAKLVDALRERTDDPEVLAELFRIQHLTTRMRRHAEGLVILSGARPVRRWRGPVPVAEVVAAAVDEIEEYARVVVPPMPRVGVGADAVADLAHLIAELLENAAAFSPPHTSVTLCTGEADDGFELRIDDRGLGMPTAEREEANRTLARVGDFDPTQSERLGLYVVGRLAGRHGIKVTLGPSPYGGTTAVVLLPRKILAVVESEPDAPVGAAAMYGAEGAGSALGPAKAGKGNTAVVDGPGEAVNGEAVGNGPEGQAAVDGAEGAGTATETAPAGAAAPNGDGHGDGAAGRAHGASTGRGARPGPATTGAPTRAGLPTRVRRSAPEPGESAPREDRAVTPEEMRSIFGSFQRGLVRGRNGTVAGPAPVQRAPRPDGTDEGTDDDD